MKTIFINYILISLLAALIYRGAVIRPIYNIRIVNFFYKLGFYIFVFMLPASLSKSIYSERYFIISQDGDTTTEDHFVLEVVYIKTF